jgi:hypothetical protein
LQETNLRGSTTRNPIIAYIGVVPAMRGNGSLDEILAEGTRTLVAQDVPRIRAATDVGDVPMARAFDRAGYLTFERQIDMVRPERNQEPPLGSWRCQSTRSQHQEATVKIVEAPIIVHIPGEPNFRTLTCMDHVRNCQERVVPRPEIDHAPRGRGLRLTRRLVLRRGHRTSAAARSTRPLRQVRTAATPTEGTQCTEPVLSGQRRRLSPQASS